MHIKPGATLIRPTIHTHLWNNRVRSGSTICSDRTDLYSLHTSLDFSGKYWVQNPCQCFQCVSASQFQLSLVVTCSTVSGPMPLLSGILQTSGPAPSAVSIPCTKLRCFYIYLSMTFIIKGSTNLRLISTNVDEGDFSNMANWTPCHLGLVHSKASCCYSLPKELIATHIWCPSVVMLFLEGCRRETHVEWLESN